MPQSPNFNDRANRVDYKARLAYQTKVLLEKSQEVKNAEQGTDKRRPNKG